MKQQESLSFSFGNAALATASNEQNAYLDSGNYSIPFASGKALKRIRRLLAFNPLSGNILVREETDCDNYNYHKTFVISRDGRPEKYKGNNF